MGNYLKTEFYTITSERVPDSFDGYRIVFLTDLHAGIYGNGNEFLLQEILCQKPDLILVGGDMLVGSMKKQEYGQSMLLLKKLTRYYPVFYAYGNHERRLSLYEHTQEVFFQYLEELEKTGVRFLDNRSVLLKKGDGRIQVTGLNLDLVYSAKWWKAETLSLSDLEKEIGKRRKRTDPVFQVLLAHNPKHFPVYAAWRPDLVLAGHFHGGMIRLPLLGGVASPDFTLFPAYDAGCFSISGTKMIVSRGLGEHTLPFRLFNPRELSVIQLEKK